ncbi:Tripartite tricarboxylate transporter family receptor [compost metagenome]
MMLYAPAKTPPAVLVKLRDAASKAVMTEGTRAKLVALGLEVPLMDERQLAQFSKAEIEKWSEIVRLSGAHID